MEVLLGSGAGRGVWPRWPSGGAAATRSSGGGSRDENRSAGYSVGLLNWWTTGAAASRVGGLVNAPARARSDQSGRARIVRPIQALPWSRTPGERDRAMPGGLARTRLRCTRPARRSTVYCRTSYLFGAGCRVSCVGHETRRLPFQRCLCIVANCHQSPSGGGARQAVRRLRCRIEGLVLAQDRAHGVVRCTTRNCMLVLPARAKARLTIIAHVVRCRCGREMTKGSQGLLVMESGPLIFRKSARLQTLCAGHLWALLFNTGGHLQLG